jgi:electron transport complex protein RnfG
MGEMIKMVVVLTILSVISGGGLGLEEWAKPKIENNVMNLVKGPAIRECWKRPTTTLWKTASR